MKTLRFSSKCIRSISYSWGKQISSESNLSRKFICLNLYYSKNYNELRSHLVSLGPSYEYQSNKENNLRYILSTDFNPTNFPKRLLKGCLLGWDKNTVMYQITTLEVNLMALLVCVVLIPHESSLMIPRYRWFSK